MFEQYDEILTVADVMELLYVGKNTVYHLLHEGELKAFRIGKTWKIPKSSLENYTRSADLHIEYCRYCKQHDYSPVSLSKFSRVLNDCSTMLGIEKHSTKQNRGFIGITLLPDRALP